MNHDNPDSKLPVPVPELELDENSPETSLGSLHHYLALSFSLPER